MKLLTFSFVLGGAFASLTAQPSTALLSRGDEAYRQGDFAAASEAYRQAEAGDRSGYAVLTRQVRLWNDLGRLTLRRSDSSEAYYRRAVNYADRLVQAHPDSATSWFLLALAHGSLTPFKSLRAKLEVARDIEQNLHTALRIDSTLAMAYVVLSIYHRGASDLTVWERMIVNTILGKRIIGTLDDADRNISTALRLEPRNPYAWYELYRVRRAQGRPAEAEQALQTLLQIPARDPRERHQHDEARAHLGLSDTAAARFTTPP